MGTFFVVPPPRGGNTHHGRRHVWSSDRAHAPRYMDRPYQWRYVATRLMAHMGAYSPDGMNGLHWRWHQRAALRIRAAMQDHNI